MAKQQPAAAAAEEQRGAAGGQEERGYGEALHETRLNETTVRDHSLKYSCTVFVGSLRHTVSAQDVMDAFVQQGLTSGTTRGTTSGTGGAGANAQGGGGGGGGWAIASATVKKNRDPKGDSFGFVNFVHLKEAQAAFGAMRRSYIGGQRIKLKPPKATASGKGPGSGSTQRRREAEA